MQPEAEEARPRQAFRPVRPPARAPGASSGRGPGIRPASAADLDAIIALDAEVTGLAKQEYWRDQLARCASKPREAPGFFLVAAGTEPGAALRGFILGEVRAWEFGSEPCGWIYAIGVDPRSRQAGLGAALLDALILQFRDCGVTKVRTMVARDDRLLLLFFRAAGMSTGPYLELARDIRA